MGQYLIDTNIVSKYLSGLLPVKGELLLDTVVDSIPQLSVITQIELLSWRSGFEGRVGEFVNDSIIFALTPEVVEACIKLRRERKMRTPDAIIAATAIVSDLILLTDNEIDFLGVHRLEVINPNKL
jgi:predicted nucleic acid-binding protein